MSIGRREANKLATKAALRQAAARLFAERGYDATTVRQIAGAAEVGERTFYRYFGTKGDLLAEQGQNRIGALQDAIRGRPAGETPYQAVARAMTALAGQAATGTGSGELLVLTATPQRFAVLQRALPRPLRQLESSIAAAARHRLGSAAPGTGRAPANTVGTGRAPGNAAADFQAQLLAGVAVAALRTAAVYHRQSAGPGSPAFAQVLEDAFAQLQDLAQPG